MHPDASEFLKTAGIELPLIGLYDAPDRTPFEPSVSPKPGAHACVFAFFKSWLGGRSAVFTREAFGCSGFGKHVFGVSSGPREAFIDFLYGQEGLKASRELMEAWIDRMECYEPENEFIVVGPLRDEQYEYLRTVTFFVNPDQLALMVYAVHYHAAPDDPLPLLAPFDSGCGQLLPGLKDLSIPQAILGATDVAMRQFVPPGIIAVTMTRPMFERICSLGKDSFLHKPFWSDLVKARKKQG
jgi:hypothetical protein